MAKKFYAQKDALGFPIPGTMMSVNDPVKVPSDSILIPAENVAAGNGQTVVAQPSGLRYFIRKDAKGNIIPNSLTISLKKPQGLVYEFKKLAGTLVTGISVKISNDNMFDPICSATTTLLVQVTSGTSLSDALTITGDFASLGAYYTPADPNNVMSQPPAFTIAYLVGGVLKNRQFKLTAVGVASGADVMFGLTQEGTCS